MTASGDRQIEITFDDNRRLPLLYGEHNVKLARIERQLGVSLATRGNVVGIAGPAHATEMTRAVLAELWRRTSAGLPVGPAEIDAVLRLAPPTGSAGSVTSAAAERRAGYPDEAADDFTADPDQARYLQAMDNSELVFGIGPAGTGKTYLAVAQAVAMLQAGKVDRIVISRPAIEAGERLGFLPGDMREKVDPYLRPIYDALDDFLPPDQVERRLAIGEIEIAPLAFMRGRTLAHAFVILDEAQNTTAIQMKMALTRLGQGSRMVVTGDPGQIDLPPATRSGLIDAIETLHDVEGLSMIYFDDTDVVHPLVARIVRAYQTVTNMARKPVVSGDRS